MRPTAQQPQRIQRKRMKGWKMPTGAVYVGRPTRWGNPYEIGPDGSREAVVQKFRARMLSDYTGTHYGIEEIEVR